MDDLDAFIKAEIIYVQENIKKAEKDTIEAVVRLDELETDGEKLNKLREAQKNRLEIKTLYADRLSDLRDKESELRKQMQLLLVNENRVSAIMEEHLKPTNNAVNEQMNKDFKKLSVEEEKYQLNFQDIEHSCNGDINYCLVKQHIMDNASRCVPSGYKFAENKFNEKLRMATEQLPSIELPSIVGTTTEERLQHILALRAAMTEFDMVLDWYYSSLSEWACWEDMLERKYDTTVEGTFDMTIMTCMNDILLRHGLFPEWMEEESTASQRYEETRDRNVDCLVTCEGADVFLFQNSLCSIDDRLTRGKQDRVKLAHALGCATRAELVRPRGKAAFRDLSGYGSVGLHLLDIRGMPHLQGYQFILNHSTHIYELHELFNEYVPLNIKDEDEGVCNVLRHMYALTLLVCDAVTLLKAPYVVHRAILTKSVEENSHSDDNSPTSRDVSTVVIPGLDHFSAALKKGASLSWMIAGKYDLNHSIFIDHEGAYCQILPAVRLCDDASVVFKIHSSSSRHLVELHALQRLSHVDGVVRLFDFFDYSGGYVLVLPLLNDVPYADVKKSNASILSFMTHALRIVRDIHSAGVAHCDIKPSAFMNDRSKCNALTLIDFNLSLFSDHNVAFDGGLPGTPGWIFADSPCQRAAEVDYIGLASVFGWLMDLPYFGDNGAYFYMLAVRQLEAYMNSTVFSSSKRTMLKIVLALLLRNTSFDDMIEWAQCQDRDETRK